MTVSDLLQSITDTLQNSATVKKVYGDPVAAEGKTIIPVAKIKYGFGAGGGNKGKKSEDNGSPESKEGGGGGGGVTVIPMGYIEVGEKYSEYVAIADSKKLIGILAGGLALGILLGNLLKSRKWFK